MNELKACGTSDAQLKSRWAAIAFALVNLAMFTGNTLAEPGNVDLPQQEPRRH